jgi:hypothetical protein
MCIKPLNCSTVSPILLEEKDLNKSTYRILVS